MIVVLLYFVSLCVFSMKSNFKENVNISVYDVVIDKPSCLLFLEKEEKLSSRQARRSTSWTPLPPLTYLYFGKGSICQTCPKPRVLHPRLEQRSECKGGVPQLSLHRPVFPLNNAERPENVRNHTSWKRNAAERCVTLTCRANSRTGSRIGADP